MAIVNKQFVIKMAIVNISEMLSQGFLEATTVVCILATV